MIQKLKRWIVRLLLVCLLPIGVVQAQVDIPVELYLTQAQSRSCTLCAATMMLRRCIYIHGSDDWQQVTEAAVGTYGWTSDGMYWNFDFRSENNHFHISQKGCGGITADKLNAVLDDHPEGIVLYCGGSAPHAVFLTDYDGTTFYCADPAYGYSCRRIPLDQSLLGERHGSQEGILRAACAYWYVDSHDVEDRGYLRNCQEYPTDISIRVRWDGYAMSLPAKEAQCERSQRRMQIRCGEIYAAQAVILNDTGEYWYRVGKDIYIHSTDAPCADVNESITDIPMASSEEREQKVVPLMFFLY